MLTSLVYLQQRNVTKSKKLMKIVNIGEENLLTIRISMKFPGKMCLMIILKITKKSQENGAFLSLPLRHFKIEVNV